MAEPSNAGRGAVIFDRDGVLNVDIGYAHRPDQIVWVEGAAQAVRAVNDAGLLALVATNQAGVARGLYSEADIEALHGWMTEQLAGQGARIDASAYCPYHPEGTVEAYRRQSDHRKPGPGMILELIQRFGLDPARTVLIGDRDSDMQAAAAAGIEGVRYEGGSLLALVAPLVARIALP